ncbi:MAG: hypothetical protein J4G01_08005 [Dehalococcoidia bacterium]|nr:hypothetical protein [Dehalococcoidia bacterium]
MTTFETEEAKGIMIALLDALRGEVEGQEGDDVPEVAFQAGKFESVANGDSAYGLGAVVLTRDRDVIDTLQQFLEDTLRTWSSAGTQPKTNVKDGP